MSNKDLKFKDILNIGNDEAKKKKAGRIIRAAKMDYDAIISEKTKEIFKLEDRLEAMTEINTSNDANNMDAITHNFDTAKFVKERCDLLVDLILKRKELKVLEADATFYEFDDVD